MSYKSILQPHQQRLRQFSFSPDDQFHPPKPIKIPPTHPHSQLLYQVYHHQSNPIYKNSSASQKISRNNAKFNQNPQLTKNDLKIQLLNNPQTKPSPNRVRAQSSHEIKPKKYYISIDKPPNPKIANQLTPNQPILSPQKLFQPNPFLANTISYHTHYTSSKQTFKNLSKSRIQQSKDLTFLNRTFQTLKKSQQKTKLKLIHSFTHKIQKQSRLKLKQQNKTKHQQWLQNQINQNSTQKYMNHLLKYHAKKTLIDKNTHQAQLIRSKLKSQESSKSQRSLIISHQKKQKAYLMKLQNIQNIQNAKIRTISRIKSRSNSVRNEMAKVYECEGELQAWRIEQIDERSKFMLATIENSKKNKELLQKVLKDSRNQNSAALYETLTKNLAMSKTSSKVNKK